MKIDNIINNMRRKRQYNKALISYNYSQISNEFQNIGRQPYIINREPLLTTLKKINEDFNKVSFSFNSMCKPNQFALPAPLPRPIIIKKQKVNIDAEINNISDLIDLCKKYPLKDDIEYNIDMKTIHNIREPLEQLGEMIGMKKLKESIVNQILFFAQKLHINNIEWAMVNGYIPNVSMSRQSLLDRARMHRPTHYMWIDDDQVFTFDMGAFRGGTKALKDNISHKSEQKHLKIRVRLKFIPI